MELLFESRTEITGTTGKVYFFQRKPDIHPEPVIPLDSSVDGAGTSLYGTILHDGGVLRMWYQAWPKDWNGKNVDLVGYAESDNGIDWRKPKLGLVDYHGTDNNLCRLNGHPPTVFIDPDAPPSHRYRATLCTGPGHQGAGAPVQEYGYYTAHSTDGLSWEYDQTTPRWNSADVITSIYHDGQRRGIVALKVSPRVNGFTRRSICRLDGIREPCRLVLNYECEPGGSVRVGLPEVPRRSEKEAVPLTRDSIGAPAAWADGDVLEPSSDKQTITATLHMDRASVYAYELQPAG